MALAMLCITCFTYASLNEGLSAKLNMEATQADGEITEDPDKYLSLMGPINKRVGELVEKYQPE